MNARVINEGSIFTPMHPLNAMRGWISGHPIAVTLILFVVSTLISLYSKEIKGFLHVWPIRTLRSYNLNNNQRQLKLLESLHNNTYRLLIYLASSVASVVSFTLSLYLFTMSINLWFSPHPTLTGPWPILWGVMTGKAFQVGVVMHELGNFDRRTAELRAAVEHDASKLALPQGTTSE